jgi:hypothetical protein
MKENAMKSRNEVIDKLAGLRGLYAGALRAGRMEEADHLLAGVRTMEWVLEGPKLRVRPANTHTRRVR